MLFKSIRGCQIMEEERAKGFYCFGTVYDTMNELA